MKYPPVHAPDCRCAPTVACLCLCVRTELTDAPEDKAEIFASHSPSLLKALLQMSTPLEVPRGADQAGDVPLPTSNHRELHGTYSIVGTSHFALDCSQDLIRLPLTTPAYLFLATFG